MRLPEECRCFFSPPSRAESSEECAVSDAQRIPLSELIAELRSELAEAQKEGAGKELRFTVEEIEIELKVGITKEVGAAAKVKFDLVQSEVTKAR